MFLGYFLKEHKVRKKTIKVCQVASVDISLRFLLFEQMKYLQRLGFGVQGVSSPGKWVKEIEANCIPVKTIYIKRKMVSPLADLLAFVRLLLFFRKEKFDIVHTHTPKASLLGQLAAVIAGVPIRVNTIHGFYFQDNFSWFERTLFITVEKIVAKCVDLTFLVNREDIEIARKEKIGSSNTIRYLGDGINVNRFNPERFSEEFIFKKKKQFCINSNNRVIGIVARLVEEKGYLDLFEAFKKVLKDFPEAILLIIGLQEPEKRDAINPNIVKNYGIQKNVLFLEQRTDVDEFYSLMDIFVLPSYREGLGLSILEASAMQRPVIVTNIRGCREAAEDGETGILVPLKNPEKLAAAMIYLLKNPKKAKEMGRKGRKKVLREFEEKLVFERIKKEYQKLIEEKLKG